MFFSKKHKEAILEEFKYLQPSPYILAIQYQQQGKWDPLSCFLTHSSIALCEDWIQYINDTFAPYYSNGSRSGSITVNGKKIPEQTHNGSEMYVLDGDGQQTNTIIKKEIITNSQTVVEHSPQMHVSNSDGEQTNTIIKEERENCAIEQDIQMIDNSEQTELQSASNKGADQSNSNGKSSEASNSTDEDIEMKDSNNASNSNGKSSNQSNNVSSGIASEGILSTQNKEGKGKGISDNQSNGVISKNEEGKGVSDNQSNDVSNGISSNESNDVVSKNKNGKGVSESADSNLSNEEHVPQSIRNVSASVPSGETNSNKASSSNISNSSTSIESSMGNNDNSDISDFSSASPAIVAQSTGLFISPKESIKEDDKFIKNDIVIKGREDIDMLFLKKTVGSQQRIKLQGKRDTEAWIKPFEGC